VSDAACFNYFSPASVTCTVPPLVIPRQRRRCVQRIARWVACACVCLCPRSKRKTARAINNKLGRHILHGSGSACIDAEFKRSKVKVTRLRKPSRLRGCYSSLLLLLLPAWGAHVVWLLIFLVGLDERFYHVFKRFNVFCFFLEKFFTSMAYTHVLGNAGVDGSIP